MSQIFNVPAIEKSVKEKHSKFLKDFGPLVDKAEADHQLLVEKVTAKVTRVLTCLRDNEIIDNTVVANEGIYKSIMVSKNGYNNHVSIWVDDKNIVMRVANIFVNKKALSKDLDDKVFFNVDTEDFDWVNFACELVEFIHNEIYSRKNVIQTKIKSIFSE